MDASQIKALKEKVQAMLKELEAELHASAGDEAVVTLDTSIGRLSRMDAMQQQQMALELKRRKEQYRLRLENALKRMDQGTYGRCGRCKGPITAERLEIQPDAVLCVHCAAPK
jgi:DnaK suppressor protein